MKIVAVRSYLKHMALTKPYSIAGYTFSDVSIAFLEVELANGIIGLGTASPAEEVVGETAEMSVANLASEFVQNLVGRNIEDFQQLLQEARTHFDHLPGTQAAIDIALHDAYGLFVGKSVSAILGRKIQALPTSVTIGLMSIPEALAEAQEFKKLGFTVLKLKTGENVEEDIEKVIRLQEIVPDLKIRVDPNQGYTLSDLQLFLKKTKDIELIEQPLPIGLENELKPLNSTILMADESITGPEAASQFAEEPKPFQIYNIKLMKSGGIQAATEIAKIAEKAKIDLFWGCNDESILSITAALHVAYAMPNTRYLDLDGSFDLAEDLVSGGFKLVNGYMHLIEKPGFGVTKL
jgi:L-alanine-DL-glutamate epimerase-like enolase superfamily enzyme